MASEHLILLCIIALSVVVIISILFLLSGTSYKENQKQNKFDRSRIVCHRNKKTLIIPEGEQAKDETQVLYFTSDKTKWHK